MTPPTSTEPMYLISESELTELEIDSSEDTYGSTDGIEIAERIRARGPVVQQAPAMAVGESRFACPFQTGCEDGEGFCEYPCEKWLDWHDAALIAQEREKWEKERDAEELAPFVKRKMAQAREGVLAAGIDLIQKRIDGIFEAYRTEKNTKVIIRPYAAAEGMNEAILMLKSLRHGQGREPE